LIQRTEHLDRREDRVIGPGGVKTEGAEDQLCELGSMRSCGAWSRIALGQG